MEDLSLPWKPGNPNDAKILAALAKARTLFYTPSIGLSASALRGSLRLARDYAVERLDQKRRGRRILDIELIIVDEVERLTAPALEFLRDLFKGAHGEAQARIAHLF